MSLIDRFLNAIKLNDDFDDDEDFLDEEEVLDEADAPEESVKPRKRFFSRFTMDDDDEEDEEDFDEYDEPAFEKKPSRTKTTSREPKKTAAPVKEKKTARTESTARKVTYAGSPSSSTRRVSEKPKPYKAPSPRRKGSLPMEVNVVRPSSMEDTREIADTLMDDCTVVLNLEGLDVDIAQRVIDFTCGVCYSLHGNLQKISSYIFILTPNGVDISGDFQSILDGAFDLPSMRGLY